MKPPQDSNSASYRRSHCKTNSLFMGRIYCHSHRVAVNLYLDLFGFFEQKRQMIYFPFKKHVKDIVCRWYMKLISAHCSPVPSIRFMESQSPSLQPLQYNRLQWITVVLSANEELLSAGRFQTSQRRSSSPLVTGFVHRAGSMQHHGMTRKN